MKEMPPHAITPFWFHRSGSKTAPSASRLSTERYTPFVVVCAEEKKTNFILEKYMLPFFFQLRFSFAKMWRFLFLSLSWVKMGPQWNCRHYIPYFLSIRQTVCGLIKNSLECSTADLNGSLLHDVSIIFWPVPLIFFSRPHLLSFTQPARSYFFQTLNV